MSIDPLEFLYEGLPPLPQLASVRRVAQRTWARHDVVAIWLGGSFGSGAADEYSDVDLRAAVSSEALESWRDIDLGALLGGDIAGSTLLAMPGGMLHHLVLLSGEIFDLWVQSADEPPPQEQIVIIGCRDDDFAWKLDQVTPTQTDVVPTDPESVRQALVSFWLNTIKHKKVLHRGLEMVAQTGISMERDLLRRLWYISATGNDNGAKSVTIHSLTETDRVVKAALGPRAQEVTGMPLADRLDLVRAIEANRNEVARVGTQLAAALGFIYPEALEQTARETWRQYLAAASPCHRWAAKRLGAAAIICDAEGRVLLVKHSYGRLNWEIPGGAADLGESVAETAVREVREETGLNVIAERLTGIYYDAEADGHHFVYMCRSADATRQPSPDNSEITECGYFSPDALPRPLSDFTEMRIRHALAGDCTALPISIGPRKWLD